jgi:hypothetical protein
MGRCGAGDALPPLVFALLAAPVFAGFAADADNYLILVRVMLGRPFVYYSSAAWDRGGDFADARGLE